MEIGRQDIFTAAVGADAKVISGRGDGVHRDLSVMDAPTAQKATFAKTSERRCRRWHP